MRAAWWLVALAPLAACTNVPFNCTTADQCRRGDEQGFCEPDHRCSFADDGCDGSKRRYAPYGTDESCVPPDPPCALAGLAAGANFTCAWSNLGHVTCWGEDGSGQLGDNASTSRSVPKKIDGLTGVVQVIAGANHACAVLRDGTVSCWGDNTYQQLGDGTATTRLVPTKVPMLPQVSALAAGGRQTCARRTDGSLWCWGRNDRGQLGDGTVMSHAMPTRVAALGNEVLDVTAGDMHTCALLMGGQVACWGWNRYGNVGPGLDLAAINAPARLALPFMSAQISAGDNHTCAVTAPDGRVQCWGLNDVGQVNRALGRMVEPSGANAGPAADLDAGGNHTCALLKDGTAQCWGASASGELGPPTVDGTGVPRVEGGWHKIASGGRHSCALSATGEVWCWGRTSEGQLGDGARLAWELPDEPVKMPNGVGAVQVASGATHSCALGTDKHVYCWGRGDNGQLGNGATDGASDPVAVELAPAVKQVVVGADFSCALLMDGSVQCWGKSTRLGTGVRPPGDATRPVAVALPADDPIGASLSAGTDHACVLSPQSAIYCWGETLQGRLGNGVAAMGTAYKAVKLVIPNVDLTQVAAGGGHTCALTRDGAVYCWGQSTYGQTGATPSMMPQLTPVVVTPLPAVDQIALGVDHSCAHSREGVLYCWGRGDQGQLGLGTGTAGGTNGLAQPNQIKPFTDFVSVNAGSSHTCGLRAGGVAMCWGANKYGQLGVGMIGGTHTTPAMVAFPQPAGTDVIDGGDRHTCAVRNKVVYCWGSNQYGQLGNGHPLSRTEPKAVQMLACP